MNDIMNKKKTIPDVIKEKIKFKILESNVESLAFKIKNGKEIDEFSESMINLVDELIEQNEEYKTNHDEKAYLNDDFVPKLYSIIGNIFIYKNLNEDRLSCEQKQWT